MKRILSKVAESEFVLGAAVVIAVIGYLYLRHGSEYFLGNSGGAYWDNMMYCKSHPASQMKVFGQLVSCREIAVKRKYCLKHIGEHISIADTTVPCDRFLDKEDDYSPWDAF